MALKRLATSVTLVWVFAFSFLTTGARCEIHPRSSVDNSVVSRPSRTATDSSAVDENPLMLSCHVCHSLVDGPKCIHLAANSTTFSTPCDKTQSACKVKRFSYTENATAPSSTWSIERNCSSKCEPGCLILGERTKLYVCTSCCNQPSCNIGNGTTSWWEINSMLHIMMALTVSVALLFKRIV